VERNGWLAFVLAGASCSLTSAGGAQAENAPATYAVSGRIGGPSASWDAAVIDQEAGRFYLAQSGVTVLDLKSGSAAVPLVPGKVAHGLAVLGEGLIAVDDSQTKTIELFDGKSGRVLKTIDTTAVNPVSGIHALDALVWDRKSRMLIAVNGNSGLLLFVDIDRAAVVGTLDIGGHPDGAVADNAGNIYVNVDRGKNTEIVKVEVQARQVRMHMPLPGCAEPTGIAFDEADGLAISVCDNGKLKFLRADTGQEAATIKVAEGADAVIYDARRHRVFVPGADDGTLSIVAVRGAHDIALVQTLRTQKGTRLGAVDEASGKVYLPAARFGAPIAPNPYPSVRPGSFEIIVVTPAI
jgi:DNA-binding beta-propeller fold protein YncE